MDWQIYNDYTSFVFLWAALESTLDMLEKLSDDHVRDVDFEEMGRRHASAPTK